MPRLAHLLLLILLAIALPFTAWAGQAQLSQPCPMHMADGLSEHADGADCCVDLAQLAKTASPCKSGQECKTASWAQALVVPLFLPVRNAAVPTIYLPSQPSCADPSGVWRPPCLI